MMNSFKLKNIAILFIAFTLFSCNKSITNDQWAKQGGGDSYDGGRGLTLDSHGNVYVVGRFQGDAQFDDKKITGNDDGIFLLKYNANGVLIWAKSLGGKKEDSGYSINIDSKDNIFITGYFSDTAHFETITLESKGDFNAYLAKFDSTGTIQWAKQAGGELKTVGRGVGTDNAGNSYMTGFFSGTISFDTIQLTSNGSHEDMFISSYDANGKLRWAKSMGGDADDRAIALASDKQGNFFITGFFTGTVAFDSTKLSSSGQTDIFIAKYNSNGNALWARHAGGVGSDEARGIDVDAQGNVYTTGFFIDKVSFESPNPIELTSQGDREIFLVKYNSNGDFKWANQSGGKGLDEGSSVCATPEGCLVTGFFGQSAAFADSLVTSSGNSDVFVARYTSDGKLFSLITAGSKGADEGRSVKQDNKNNIYITGNYDGVLDIGNTLLHQSLGDGDVFVAKLVEKPSAKK